MKEEQIGKHSSYSFKLIIFLFGIIILGIVMSYYHLPGLPFSIPGSGFLIAHVIYSVIKRRPRRDIILLSVFFVITVIITIVLFIELVDFLNYFALQVCLVSASVWLIGESIYWAMKKKPKNV